MRKAGILVGLASVLVTLLSSVDTAVSQGTSPYGSVDASGTRSYRCFRSPATTVGVNPLVVSCDPVPAKFRLVTTHVSVLYVQQAGGEMWVRFGVPPNLIMLEWAPSVSGATTATHETWLVSSRPVQMRFEADEVPTIQVGRIPATWDGGMEVSVHGYLVAVP